MSADDLSDVLDRMGRVQGSLVNENPVFREFVVADGQRWLDVCGNHAIYAQTSSHLWRDYLFYGAIRL